MPSKDNFDYIKVHFEIDHIASLMPGGKVNITDDGGTMILDNDAIEVVLERTEPDDPECETFVLVSADAEDPELNQFIAAVEAENH